jgi:hypothetical protein
MPDQTDQGENPMDTSAMEKELEGSVVAAFQPLKGFEGRQREETLSDQIAKLERINVAVTEKIRAERLSLRITYERQLVEIRTSYAEKIANEVAKLEKQRDAALLALTQTTSLLLHDLEQLERRRGG